MKYSLLFVVLFTGLSAVAQTKEMTVLQKKLYQYIVDTQIRNHVYPSYVGSWPTQAKVAHLVDFEMTSSFEVTQILLFLRSISNYVTVPNRSELNDVFNLGYRQLDEYLRESTLTKEPPGSINFYPFLNAEKQMRGYPSRKRDLAFKILGLPIKDADIPNDWDCSARTYVLLHEKPKYSNWASSFADSVGQWVDMGRERIHPTETWKTPDTGSFLTWAEPDMNSQRFSRIPDRVNDVDCVVNLNILEALGISESYQPLPQHTRIAKNNACKMINSVISEGFKGSANRCSPYYNRASQVLLSYVRAFKTLENGENCLSSSKQEALKMALDLAKLAIPGAYPHNSIHEKAELVIALKSLVPASDRTPEVNQAIGTLLEQLKKPIQHNGRVAVMKTVDSMYYYYYRSYYIEFWSRAYSNALVLLAMVMP